MKIILYTFYIALWICLSNAQDNRIERRFACWGSAGPPVVSAQCPRNMVLDITRAGLKVQATAGRCEFKESDCGCTSDEDGCQMPDVRDLCMSKSSCRLDVTQQYIGTGRCHGFSDYMYIEYKCVQATQEDSHDICQTGSLQHSSGFLQSPNHPNPYPDNRHCECTLSSVDNASIDIQILDLQLRDRDCNNDYVTLEYDGQETMFCGQSNGLRETISTGATDVLLSFRTDGSGVDNGFWIKYQAQPRSPIKINCVSKVRDESVDESPSNDDKTSPGNTALPEVTWNIVTPSFAVLEPELAKDNAADLAQNTAENIEELEFEENILTSFENENGGSKAMLEFTDSNIVVDSDVTTLLSDSYDLNRDTTDENDYSENEETVIISDGFDYGVSNTIFENELGSDEQYGFENALEESYVDNFVNKDDAVVEQPATEMRPVLSETPRQDLEYEPEITWEIQPRDEREPATEEFVERPNLTFNEEQTEYNVVQRTYPNGRRRISRLNLIRFRQRMRNQNNRNVQDSEISPESALSSEAENTHDDAINRIEATRQDFERFSNVANEVNNGFKPRIINVRERLDRRQNMNSNNMRTPDKLPFEDYENEDYSQMMPNNLQLNDNPTRQYFENEIGRISPTRQTTTPWWWKYTAKQQPLLTTQSSTTSEPKLAKDLKNNKLFDNRVKQGRGERLFAQGKRGNSPDNIAGDILHNVEGDKKQDGNHKIYAEKQQQSATVTVVIVGIIGLIVLIIIVAIAVRWVMNKREAKRAWRQRHRKECALRQQAARQSKRHP